MEGKEREQSETVSQGTELLSHDKNGSVRFFIPLMRFIFEKVAAGYKIILQYLRDSYRNALRVILYRLWSHCLTQCIIRFTNNHLFISTFS